MNYHTTYEYRLTVVITFQRFERNVIASVRYFPTQRRLVVTASNVVNVSTNFHF